MSDIISRADAIEAIQNAYCKPCKERGDDYNEIRCRACEYDNAIIQIDALPSADTSSDLISRANAIRWVKTECNQYGKPTLDYDSGLKVIEHLKKMPSELPSTEAEWISREHFDVLKKNYDMLAGLLEEAKARAIGAWIPCSKRLPKEEKETYWVCTDTEYQCECRWTNNRFGIGEGEWGWSIFDTPQYSKPIAWMPLPKPYKGGDDE